jgi:transglutaminase-like putative cysteine protease
MKLRSVVAWSIFIGWLTIVGVHVKREYFVPEAERLAEGARRLAPGSYYYVVRLNGRAIGTATTQFIEMPDSVPPGYLLTDDLLLDVPAMDAVHRAVTQSRIRLDTSLRMTEFTFRLGSRIGDFHVAGTAKPDSSLDLVVNAGGGTQRARVPITGGGAILDGAIGPRLAAAGRLRVGEAATVRTFDPSALETRDVTIRVTAVDTLIVPDSADVVDGLWRTTVWDTIPVWRLEQDIGSVSMASWVDEDGLVVRAESPLGFAIERTTYEMARQEWVDARGDPTMTAGYGSLIESTAIASNVNLHGIETRPDLSVRLRGVDLSGFDLSGGRQTLTGDTLTVTAESLREIAGGGYTLPYRGTSAEALAELGATPLIQSDDRRIRERAESILGEVTDPVEAARKLNGWVFSSVRKEITPSIPSAIQVLRALRGDCNEHTVLFVALARSVGLPARTAIGLVSIEGRFYYHAWPEVWLADRWVAMDPTLGQFPADASHLRFLVGGLARQVELIRLIGRLEIEAI